MNKITFVFSGPVQLRRFVRRWQNRLGLRDWTIKADLVNSLSVYGACIFSIPDRTARITIMDVADYKPVGAEPNYDAEETLVHEMLHLVSARLKEDGIEMEAVIQQIARSLVKAYR